MTPETLGHWMKWESEPYITFQRLVRKAEADLEARMVKILTDQAEVRPELALAVLERKFPVRWARVHVIAMPPPSANKMDLGQMLQQIDVQRQAEQVARGQLPPATIIEGRVIPDGRPRDPWGPRPVRPPDDGAARPADSAEPTARAAEPTTPVESHRSVGPATITRLGVPRPSA